MLAAAIHGRPAPLVSLGSRAPLLYGLFFFMSSSFRYPALSQKLLPAGILSVLMLLEFGGGLPWRRQPRLLAVLLGLLFVAGTVSFLCHADQADSQVAYLAAFLSPFVTFTACRALAVPPRLLRNAFLALSLGLIVPLLGGVWQFYRAFGIPDLTTLVLARFDTDRMEAYQSITFGNVNNTAALVMLVLPPLLALAIDRETHKGMRLWFALCALAAAANLLIVFSRAAFLVVPLFVLPILYVYRRRALGAVLIAAVVLVPVAWMHRGSVTSALWWDYMHSAFYPQMQSDNSVNERLDSIGEGLTVIREHPLVGVGPGRSYHYITYDTAHQMSVQQGVETGILGLAAISALTVAVAWEMIKAATGRTVGAMNRQRFLCLIGPFAYLTYGALANAPLTIGPVNIWITNVAAMLALADSTAEGQLHRPPPTTGQGRGET
jgi:O-antigen ligase